MDLELRFGLDFGRLALLKKKRFGPIMINFLGHLFQVFMGKKKIKKNCSVCAKELQKVNFFSKKIKKTIFSKNFNCVLFLRKGEPGLFTFEYNLLQKLIPKKVTTWIG